MTVLYRKYRPQAFAEVAGQEHVKTTILQQVAGGRLGHCYLFTGPRGVGKTTVARLLAKAVNCRARAAGSGEPCGECASCREIAEGRALDVIEIDAASHTGVDNVREQIVEHARFAPSSAPYKVFIIDEAHMLSTSAFNALLKTLEEPPAHALFVLATTELHKVPATVVSRCQRFDFRKLNGRELAARLAGLAAREGVEVDAEVLEAVARQSEGCLRDAESLLGQVLSLGGKKVTKETASLILPIVSAEALYAFSIHLIKRQIAAFSMWENLCRDGADPIRLAGDTAEILRAMTLSKVRGMRFEPPFPADEATKASLEEARDCLDAATGSELIQKVLRAREEMKRTDLAELPMELLIVEWNSGGPTVAKRVRSLPDQEPPMRPPSMPSASSGGTPAAAPEPAPQAEGGSAELSVIKEKWTEILRLCQEKNHALPYMLGAAELLGSESGTLTIGFQYALYRDRLNEKRHRTALEEAIAATVGTRLRVQAVLVAQKPDGLVEPLPDIRVEAAATKNLPEGFAELVKEFGGTIASS
jgi:DNA polymerase-3 subunit gamma/tau